MGKPEQGAETSIARRRVSRAMTSVVEERETVESQNKQRAAVLSDLGQQQLVQGDVEEAQKLFKEALTLTSHTSSVQEDANSPEEADWERDSWEEHVPQIAKPSPAKPSRQSEQSSTGALHSSLGGPAEPAAGDGQPQLPCAGANQQEQAQVPFDGAHILEFYDLKKSHTTTHLETFLNRFDISPVGPVVRWADEQHALAVCPNPAAARIVLAGEPASAFKLRPFSEASAASLKVPAIELQPPRPRPRTTTAVARRFIGAALNMTDLRDKAAEKDLRQQRQQRAAAEKERKAQLAAAWGDE